mmetsp:Transcript_11230/g.33711  ORF Transcript_11230/g.33711 Transcript_11230/m.33711 type:complete len:301 (-) Transcript_11230:275-1177(-)
MSAPLPGSPTAARSLQGPGILLGRRNRSQRTVTAAGARFRPCIDIHKGQVKQIVGSTLADLDEENREGEEAKLITNFEAAAPSTYFAELYQKDQLYGGHVIMLGADPESKEAALNALQAFQGGMHVGGGITAENAGEYLDAGASHVIVTSHVFRNGRLEQDRLNSLVRAVGKKRLVLDLSCRKRGDKYYVVTDRWQKFSELAVEPQQLDVLAKQCDEFLVHGVDVEGKQLGIDEELVALLGAHCPCPVTYAGGARTLDDLRWVDQVGKGHVDITVGSALDIFGGELPYWEVVQWNRLNNS